MIGIWLVVQTVLPSAAQAQEPEPWDPEVVGVLRSFFERADVEEVLEGLRAPEAGISRDSIDTLASRLPAGVEGPLGFVRDRIRHTSYPGSVLGPAGTLRAGAGNALDQAALLTRLYRQRGSRARLVRGRLRWDDAVRLVGDQPDRLSPGDPWLRRVEQAADHWWVEVEAGDGSWVQVDPAFPDSGSDRVPGVRREVHDLRPRALIGSARVRLLAGEVELSRTEIEAGELVDRGVRLVLSAAPRTPDEIVADDPVEQPDAGDEDALDRFLERIRAGALQARLSVADEAEAVDVPRGAGDLRLELRVDLPHASPLLVEVPVEARGGNSIAAVVGSGHLSGRLSRESRPVFDLLRELEAAERTTLEAYLARPGEEPPRGAEEGDADEIGAAPERVDAVEGGEASGEIPMHSARRLHLASLRAWERFGRTAPAAFGAAVLAAIDRVHDGLAVEPAPLRIAIVRLQAPGPGGPGSLSVWSSGEVRFARLDGATRREARAGFGFLRSAVIGQVLHRVADAAPLTAFDFTLRSVGRGTRLSWWRERGGLPGSWPRLAREMAGADMSRGYTVVGSRERPEGEEAVVGWWAVDRNSGRAEGRVLRDGVMAEAMVDFGPLIEPGDLGSVLASLPALHVASRWLVQAALPEAGALEPLVPGACAATSLVGELVEAGAPPGFVTPRFGPFCGGVAAHR